MLNFGGKKFHTLLVHSARGKLLYGKMLKEPHIMSIEELLELPQIGQGNKYADSFPISLLINGKMPLSQV
jgi:hypothetical protein